MNYKVYKESRFLDIDWDNIKTMIMKPVNAHKHRNDRLYLDDEDLWFWHDNKRKKVSLHQIKSVQKASLHGFGSMINIVYRSSMKVVDDGKEVDLHLVDVSECENSPEELAKLLTEKAEIAYQKKNAGRKVHKFPGGGKKPNQPSNERL